MSDFPHKCIDCGCPCYIGAFTVSCSNKACRHFKIEEKTVKDEKIESSSVTYTTSSDTVIIGPHTVGNPHYVQPNTSTDDPDNPSIYDDCVIIDDVIMDPDDDCQD